MRQENLLDIEYVNRNGDSMRGPLVLAGEPILGAHAATKRYIDTVLANLRVQAILRDGSQAMTGPLMLSGAPASALEATTKAYVDGIIAGIVAAYATTIYVDAGDAAERVYSDAQDALLLPLAGGVMVGDITLQGAPTNNLHPATRLYTDTADALRLLLAGGTMLGMLTLNGAPVDPLDAATKGYVDTADALRLLLAGGTMLGMLTLNGVPVDPLDAATKGYVDGAIPSTTLDTYDAVVAAADGDYTSVVSACATEAVGARIFVKPGTYNETADILMKDGQMLIGQNPDTTIIDFGAANRQLTYQGGPENLYVSNLTLQNSIADYVIHLLGDYARVDNCRLIGSAAGYGGVYLSSTQCIISRCHFSGFARSGFYCATVGNYGIVANNTFVDCENGIKANLECIVIGNTMSIIGTLQVFLESYSVLTGNVLFGEIAGITVSGLDVAISGNHIRGANGIEWDAAHNGVTITGNIFFSSRVRCTITNVQDVTITGNTFMAGNGIHIAGQRFSVTGNTFQGAAFIELTADGKYCTIVGNSFAGSSAANKIVDAGVANLAKNNNGVPSIMEKHFTRMKNTSGGALVAGDTVAFKAVAAGNEFTTTVNQGDDLVYGMLDENIGNNAYGYIQDEGKTVRLKVNGVVNIAIGDLIGTFTTAGISMKAAAGDMAFAIALEAYAGADSNGIIDALLVSPRKI